MFKTLTIKFFYSLKIESRYSFCVLETIDEFIRILQNFKIVRHNIGEQDFRNNIITLEFMLDVHSNCTLNDIIDSFQNFKPNKYILISIIDVTLTPDGNENSNEQDIIEDNYSEDTSSKSTILKDATKKNKRRTIVSLSTIQDL
jgi:hypothetical protein